MFAINSSSCRTAKCLITLLLLHCPVLTLAHQAFRQFFTKTPSNVTVLEGQDVTLECGVGGESLSRIAVSWTKDQGAISDKNAFHGYPRYSMAGDPTQNDYSMKISKAKLEDDGVFECQVRPAHIRAAATVTILVPPASVRLEDDIPSGSVLERKNGTDLKTTCRVSASRPPATVRWYRNNEVLSPSFSTISTESSRDRDPKIVDTMSKLRYRLRPEDDRAVFRCDVVHPALDKGALSANYSLMVLYAPDEPVIKGYNEVQTLTLGQRITLRCQVANGNPLPTVWWLRNGQTIDFDSKASRGLTVNEYTFNVGAEDDGAEYECRAANSMTHVPRSASVKLTVYYGPETATIHGPDEARVGDRVDLSCETGPSRPRAKVEWMIEGRLRQDAYTSIKANPDGPGTITVSNVSYVIPNSKHLNAHCTALNEAFHDSSFRADAKLKIEILHPPEKIEIFGYETPEPLRSGAAHRLTCVATGGNPLARLFWYRGKEALSNDNVKVTVVDGRYTQSELTIPSLAPVDNIRAYRCEAQSKALTDTMSATVNFTVHFPSSDVQIKIRNQSGAVIESELYAGTAVSFDCESKSANPAPILLLTQSDRTLTTIRVHSIPAEHGGMEVRERYNTILGPQHHGARVGCRAVIKDTEQSVSTARTLKVLYSPIFVRPLRRIFNVLEDESVTLNATAYANPAKIAYTWTKDGVVVKSRVRRLSDISVDGPLLRISKVNRRDAGTYVVTASNAVPGNESSVHLELAVKYPPVIIKKSITGKVQAARGQTAVLTCEADAFPKLRDFVRWERKNYAFDNPRVNQTYNNGKASLRIQNAQVNDTGYFYCVANNGIGPSIKSKAQLLINHPAKIERPPSALLDKGAAALGQRFVELRCKARGWPAVEIRWRKDGGQLLQEGSKYGMAVKSVGLAEIEGTLRINFVERRDYGTYICVARNAEGSDDMRVLLSGLSKPDPPVFINITNVTDTTATLEWLPGFDGGSPQQFKIRYTETGKAVKLYSNSIQQGQSKIITNLRPNTMYSFAVVAINSHGPSTWTTNDINNRPVFATTYGANLKQAAAGISSVWEVTLGLLAAGLVLVCLKIICLVYFLRKRRHKKLRETAATRRLVSPTMSKPPPSVVGPEFTGSRGARIDFLNGHSSGSAVSDDQSSVRTVIELGSKGNTCVVERVNSSSHQTFLGDNRIGGSVTLPRKDYSGPGIPPGYYSESLRSSSLQRRGADAPSLTTHPETDLPRVKFAHPPVQSPPVPGSIHQLQQEMPPPMGPLRSFSQELNNCMPDYVSYKPVIRSNMIKRCSPESQSVGSANAPDSHILSTFSSAPGATHIVHSKPPPYQRSVVGSVSPSNNYMHIEHQNATFNGLRGELV